MMPEASLSPTTLYGVMSLCACTVWPLRLASQSPFCPDHSGSQGLWVS